MGHFLRLEGLLTRRRDHFEKLFSRQVRCEIEIKAALSWFITLFIHPSRWLLLTRIFKRKVLLTMFAAEIKARHDGLSGIRKTLAAIFPRSAFHWRFNVKCLVYRARVFVVRPALASLLRAVNLELTPFFFSVWPFSILLAGSTLERQLVLNGSSVSYGIVT